ncbi:MAG TPA: hypothetical protein P5531_03980 [Bacteroidales bacterium]|nr:hypothetical protein [Bacteroidales bacterium]
MTILQAVEGELSPYTVDSNAISKVLVDNELSAGDPYTVNDKVAVAIVTVTLLRSLLSLSSESQGGYSQAYDRVGLQKRIDAIVDDNGLAASMSSVPRIRDRSTRW